MERPSAIRNSPPVSAALKHTNAAARGARVPTNSLCIPVGCGLLMVDGGRSMVC